jgi:hypothetical protein
MQGNEGNEHNTRCIHRCWSRSDWCETQLTMKNEANNLAQTDINSYDLQLHFKAYSCNRHCLVYQGMTVTLQTCFILPGCDSSFTLLRYDRYFV